LIPDSYLLPYSLPGAEWRSAVLFGPSYFRQRVAGMKAAWQVATVLCLTLLAGCGGPGAETARVKGKVTVAGQPVKGILVNFTPEAGGRPAFGVTDDSGAYSLSTFSDGDGAVPGKHQVSFGMESAEPAPGDYSGKAPTLPFNAKYSLA
jgi:hypothetical protein